MADKKQKSRTKSGAGGTPRSYSQLYKDDRTGVAGSRTPVQTARAQGTSSQRQAAAPVVPDITDWRASYSYVLSDLRLLVAVTATVVLLMIVAGMVI